MTVDFDAVTRELCTWSDHEYEWQKCRRCEKVAAALRKAAADAEARTMVACATIARDRAEVAYRERLNGGGPSARLIANEEAARQIQHAIEDRARGLSPSPLPGDHDKTK